MDTLCKTYNTNSLDKISKTEQYLFEKTSELLHRKHVGNTTLMNLIYNNYNTPQPYIDYINGPMSLSQHYSEKYDKIIYIFGESHGITDSCPYNNSIDISQYLSNLLETTNVFLDIFIETFESKVYPKKSLTHVSYINDLRYTMFDSINPLTRQKNSLGRVHYFDIRYYQDDEFSKLFTLLGTNIKDITLLRPFSNLIIRLDYNNIKLYLLEYIKTNKFLSKEIKKSFLKVFDDIIDIFFNDIDEYSFNDVINAINNPENHQTLVLIKFLTEKIFIITSIVIDLYVIARIFKKFNNPDNQPDEPYNIIIYSGNEHAKMQRRILGLLGFDQIEQSRKHKFNRCLDMTNFKQPLFGGKFVSKMLKNDGEIVNIKTDIPLFRKTILPDDIVEFHIAKIIQQNPYNNIVKIYKVTESYIDEELVYTDYTMTIDDIPILIKLREFLVKNNILYIDWKFDNFGRDIYGNLKLFDFNVSGIGDKNGWKIKPFPGYLFKNASKITSNPYEIDKLIFNDFIKKI